jgi:putative redox protein
MPTSTTRPCSRAATGASVTVRVSARRLQGFAHEIDIEGGHTIVVDEPAAAGGTDTGPSPGRLLAASLAACTAVTMEMYAERKGWTLGAVEVAVDADYEEHVPRSFEVTVRLSDELSEEQRERLLAIASKCPVHRALTGKTDVTIADRVEVL